MQKTLVLGQMSEKKNLKMVSICYKNEKNPLKLAFLQDFRFYQ